jgi:hypothetical protein
VAQSLATVEELARWTQWELSTPAESAQAEDVLLMASEWARSIAGKPWPTAQDAPRTVVGIILASARREIENPRRATYEVMGPMAASYSQQNCPPGFFTEGEYKFLRRQRKGAGLWSLTSYKDDEDLTIGYLYAIDMNKPIPMFSPLDPGWDDTDHL